MLVISSPKPPPQKRWPQCVNDICSEVPMLRIRNDQHHGEGFGVSTVVLALSIWIEKKVCPMAKEIKEKYTDATGRQRLRLRHEFED